MNEEEILSLLRKMGFNNLCNGSSNTNGECAYSNVSVNKIQTGEKEFFFNVSVVNILVQGGIPASRKKASETKYVYNFDENGRYRGKESSNFPDQQEHMGYSDKNKEFFIFADSENDPLAIDTTTKYTPQIIMATDSIIYSILEISGVYKEENQGLISGSKYLWDESAAYKLEGGLMDYAGSGAHNIDVGGATFYITKTRSGTVAHNGYNYGNFLWGAGANALGVPEWMARLGAHYQNYVNDSKHKGTLDSEDDQFSIQLGYEWIYKTSWGRELEEHFKKLREEYIRETNGTPNIWY